jgi:hypothetical protein
VLKRTRPAEKDKMREILRMSDQPKVNRTQKEEEKEKKTVEQREIMKRKDKKRRTDKRVEQRKNKKFSLWKSLYRS